MSTRNPQEQNQAQDQVRNQRPPIGSRPLDPQDDGTSGPPGNNPQNPDESDDVGNLADDDDDRAVPDPILPDDEEKGRANPRIL